MGERRKKYVGVDYSICSRGRLVECFTYSSMILIPWGRTRCCGEERTFYWLGVWDLIAEFPHVVGNFYPSIHVGPKSAVIPRF